MYRRIQKGLTWKRQSLESADTKSNQHIATFDTLQQATQFLDRLENCHVANRHFEIQNNSVFVVRWCGRTQEVGCHSTSGW
jgi:hypothetical protein